MKMLRWECPGYEGRNEQPAACSFEFPVRGTLPEGVGEGAVRRTPARVL